MPYVLNFDHTQSDSDEFILVALVHAAAGNFVIMVYVLWVGMSVTTVEVFDFHGVLHFGSVKVVDGHARTGDPDRSHGETARGLGEGWVCPNDEMVVLLPSMVWVYLLCWMVR